MIDDLTTENSQVRALPDGTYELTATRVPERVKQGSEWVSIDTALSMVNGVISPAAAIGGVEFSAGGDGPMVTLHEDADGRNSTVSIDWEGTLPTPVLDGSSATYRSVRPGVDLVLTAQPAGYSQTLVVSDAEAAAALIADPVDLTAATDDLEFAATTEGHVSATGATAETEGTVFDGAPPVLWDSNSGSGNPDSNDPVDVSGEIPTATDPANGRILHAETDLDIATDGSSMDLTLAPPPQVLTDESIVYPLYLDPRLERNRFHYLTVHSRGWNYYDDSTEPMRVGFCDWSECNQDIQGTARSYFSFEAPGLFVEGFDPTIYDAAVRVLQKFNATGTAQPVELHGATGFVPSTEWPGPLGGKLETVSSAAG